MNKTELIAAMAEKAGLTKVDAGKALNAYVDSVKEQLAKGEKVEVKFSTSDAYAHPINASEVVDYYLVITYSKKLGLQVFKVPYAKRNEIDRNAQSRITINQKVKFLDKDLTEKLTPRY